MFENASPGAARPTLFCLHYLGGSAREWTGVAMSLRDTFDVVALDLPGFGSAARTPGYSVEAMARTISDAIRAAAPRRYLLAGHSMGAKVAAVVARASETGDAGLGGLMGIVTIAGSPPAPEPMGDAERAAMLGWFVGSPAESRAQAADYIAKNGGPRLDAEAKERAVADVLRMNGDAWRAWLTSGSREDWSARIGVLGTRALVIAGADDENLGPDAQARLTATHFRDVRLVTIPNAKHLLPLTCPDELGRTIRTHFGRREAAHTPIAPSYGELIASARVSSGTRRALLERAALDDPDDAPAALDARAFATLRAVVERVLPQTEAGKIDLAARIDRDLAAGIGDGWRFDTLPPDAEAYRSGLLKLHEAALTRYERAFVELDAARSDALLDAMATGSLGSNMQAWFEDVRADVVKRYVAHPRTLARIGYSGIANGGDDLPKTGFVRVGIDDREPWEPVAAADAAR